jgi:hypothetical protein
MLLSFLTTVLSLVGLIVTEYLKGAPERKRKHDALTTHSLSELDAGIQRVRGTTPLPPQ